jgi:hypothetical protein
MLVHLGRLGGKSKATLLLNADKELSLRIDEELEAGKDIIVSHSDLELLCLKQQE